MEQPSADIVRVNACVLRCSQDHGAWGGSVDAALQALFGLGCLVVCWM